MIQQHLAEKLFRGRLVKKRDKSFIEIAQLIGHPRDLEI